MNLANRTVWPVVLAVVVAASAAAAADLDRTFGSGGKVVTDVSGRYDEIRAVAVRPDGGIVVAGVTGTAPNRDLAGVSAAKGQPRSISAATIASLR
jgi:hypothetical protein